MQLVTEFHFERPKRPVKCVFLHCSASDAEEHDRALTMQEWHLKRGFAEIGYHYFIRKDGGLEIGRSLEKIPAAQQGHNTGSIAICLHGLMKERFTTVQLETCRRLCVAIHQVYQGNITFHGHCEVAAKACPVFDYQTLLKLDADGRVAASLEAAYLE